MKLYLSLDFLQVCLPPNIFTPRNRWDHFLLLVDGSRVARCFAVMLSTRVHLLDAHDASVNIHQRGYVHVVEHDCRDHITNFRVRVFLEFDVGAPLQLLDDEVWEDTHQVWLREHLRIHAGAVCPHLHELQILRAQILSKSPLDVASQSRLPYALRRVHVADALEDTDYIARRRTVEVVPQEPPQLKACLMLFHFQSSEFSGSIFDSPPRNATITMRNAESNVQARAFVFAHIWSSSYVSFSSVDH